MAVIRVGRAAATLLLFHVLHAQPLPGGGGGGGGFGGGGGGGGSSNSDPSPVCPSHCRYCTTSYVCDICDSGYVRNHVGQCLACAANCVECDRAGAHLCDECRVRYALTPHRTCGRCSEHCYTCDEPGTCNVCDDGYFLVNDGHGLAHTLNLQRGRLCEACAPNCKRCKGAAVEACETCFFWYQMQFDGSCAFRTYTVTALVLAMLPLVKLLVDTCRSSRAGSWLARTPGRSSALAHPMGQAEFVAQESLAPAEALPSGMWRGYYTFSGTRHDVCEFNMSYSHDGRITGEGVDDVGHYTIAGCYNRARLAFSKTYVPRSTNVSGVVTFGNKGHSVEYRGELAGSSLGSGFRGAWTIRHNIGNYDGEFHLWPAMQGWTDQTANAAEEGGGRTFEENECVVCYDRAISTCLRPCGHVALCGICVARLQPRTCPLCRQAFTHVENFTPAQGRGGSGHEE